jgi:hypothetical protein
VLNYKNPHNSEFFPCWPYFYLLEVIDLGDLLKTLSILELDNYVGTGAAAELLYNMRTNNLCLLLNTYLVGNILLRYYLYRISLLSLSVFNSRH